MALVINTPKPFAHNTGKSRPRNPSSGLSPSPHSTADSTSSAATTLASLGNSDMSNESTTESNSTRSTSPTPSQQLHAVQAKDISNNGTTTTTTVAEKPSLSSQPSAAALAVTPKSANSSIPAIVPSPQKQQSSASSATTMTVTSSQTGTPAGLPNGAASASTKMKDSEGAAVVKTERKYSPLPTPYPSAPPRQQTSPRATPSPTSRSPTSRRMHSPTDQVSMQRAFPSPETSGFSIFCPACTQPYRAKGIIPPSYESLHIFPSKFTQCLNNIPVVYLKNECGRKWLVYIQAGEVDPNRFTVTLGTGNGQKLGDIQCTEITRNGRWKLDLTHLKDLINLAETTRYSLLRVTFSEKLGTRCKHGLFVQRVLYFYRIRVSGGAKKQYKGTAELGSMVPAYPAHFEVFLPGGGAAKLITSLKQLHMAPDGKTFSISPDALISGVKRKVQSPVQQPQRKRTKASAAPRSQSSASDVQMTPAQPMMHPYAYPGMPQPVPQQGFVSATPPATMQPYVVPPNISPQKKNGYPATQLLAHPAPPGYPPSQLFMSVNGLLQPVSMTPTAPYMMASMPYQQPQSQSPSKTNSTATGMTSSTAQPHSMVNPTQMMVPVAGRPQHMATPMGPMTRPGMPLVYPMPMTMVPQTPGTTASTSPALGYPQFAHPGAGYVMPGYPTYPHPQAHSRSS